MIINKRSKGIYSLSQVQNGTLVSRVYFGYTKRECIKLFREHLLLSFLKRNRGLHTIAPTERKAAERLKEKGYIILVKHDDGNWQAESRFIPRINPPFFKPTKL
jgi:hypothetical protein